MLTDQLMAIEIPAEYGGTEASFTTAIIAIEELAKVDPSISVMADVHVFHFRGLAIDR
jgi:short-chain 2-methylacyl-CoA dehydrogenase